MKHIVVFLALLLVFVCLDLFAQGEAPQWAPDTLSERVVCLEAPEQAYALYLPPGYTPQRPWPVLFCFDAGGRGALPVRRLQPAAAEFGYIVVGSYAIHNGPYEENAARIRVLFRDVRQRFNLNENRVYAAGFSGGARLACGMGAVLGRPLTGVIACGAGLPPWLKPEGLAGTMFCGLVGIDDFNAYELKGLAPRLAAAGVTRRVAWFAGRHEWPPAELLAAALRWLEVQAVKSGLRSRDEALLQVWRQREEADLQAAAAWLPLPDAVSAWKDAADLFAGCADVTTWRENARRLRESPEYKRALKDEERWTKQENEMRRRLQEAYIRAMKSTPDERSLRAMDIPGLHAAAEKPTDGAARGARRLLGEMLGVVVEDAGACMQRRDGRRAAFAFAVAAAIEPQRAVWPYNQACALALAGERQAALQALKSAVEKGFSDADRLRNDPDLAPLRGEPGFAEIVAALERRQAPFPG